MSTRQSNRSNNNDDFNLDDYIREKSTETKQPTSEPDQKSSGFTKFIRTGLFALSVLAFIIMFNYDWNPVKVYEAFWGTDETSEALVGEGAQFPEVVTPQPPSTPPLPPTLPPDRVASLEQAAVNFAESEELRQLTEQSISLALESALAALQNLEGLEDLESLENLGELAALEALENIDFSTIEINFDQNADALSLDAYTKELHEAGIEQFSESDLIELREAGIPSDFVIQLQEIGILSKLDTAELIRLFKE